MEKEKNEINMLVIKAKENDKAALASIIEHFYPKIYRYIFYKVSNKEEAEDLTQEVFLKMVKSLKNQNGYFTAWLYKIASNLVIDFYRHQSFKKEVPFDDIKQEAIYEQSKEFPENTLTEEQFKKVLAGLTEEQREVIILKFVQGYKNDEIAQLICKSEGAVKGLQFRALETLKNLLKEKGQYDTEN